MKKVRDFLNKILWDKRERPEDYEITFIHRGAHMDRRTIPCKSITGVERSWFIYINDVGEDVVIPFHRVTKIRNVKNNEFTYKSRKPQIQ